LDRSKRKRDRRYSAATTVKGELPTRPASSAVSKHRSWGFYGPSGTGKTTIVGSFPAPILLMDINDEGSDSLADLGDDVQIMTVQEWDDLEEAYWWLVENPGRFKTVVLDTVTELQEIAIRKILTDVGKDPNKSADWGSMSRQQWGEVSGLMKTWITNFRNLSLSDPGIDVVFNAQQRIFNAEEDAEDSAAIAPEIGPRLSPSVSDHLRAALSVIGSTYIRERRIKDKKTKKITKKIQYCLRIGPNPTYITKIRKPKSVVLPDVLVDPTYEDIIAVMKGE